MEEIQKPQKTKTLIMASYGNGKFLAEFFIGAFGALVFKFYETEIGLSAGYSALAIILYSIWNAVNDPLIGFLTSKPTPFSGKLGRRFPWIFIGSVLWGFSFLLIFAVPKSLNPETDSILIFFWMLGSICLFDTFFSLWEVNYQSIFPDKFRDKDERSKAAGIATFIGVFGIAIGTVLPGLIINYGDTSSYLLNGWVFLGIGLIVVLLLIPGVKETKPMIDRYMKSTEKEEESFLSQMKHAFKFKNFVAFILLYFFYQSGVMSMTGSVHYVGDYVLPGGSSDVTVIFAGMLIGALVSIPFWILIAKKVKGHQNVLIITALLMAVFSFPMTFINTYTGFTVMMALWGAGFGGFWLMMTPAMADVIDEVVLSKRKRDDGVLLGFRAFFGRLSWAVQASSFWLIHSLTGFAEDPHSPSAIFGIHLHMGLVPSLLILTGVIIFWKMNTLNAGKMELIRKELEELNL
jgi:glycoside/pentoside/hexuronide:cation symporter, GPH family